MIAFVERFSRPTAAPADPLMRRLAELSPAEREILGFLRQGMSNKEIACARGRSTATVKNQVSVCLKKLGVQTRTRLVVLLAAQPEPAGCRQDLVSS